MVREIVSGFDIKAQERFEIRRLTLGVLQDDVISRSSEEIQESSVAASIYDDFYNGADVGSWEYWERHTNKLAQALPFIAAVERRNQANRIVNGIIEACDMLEVETEIVLTSSIPTQPDGSEHTTVDIEEAYVFHQAGFNKAIVLAHQRGAVDVIKGLETEKIPLLKPTKESIIEAGHTTDMHFLRFSLPTSIPGIGLDYLLPRQESNKSTEISVVVESLLKQ